MIRAGRPRGAAAAILVVASAAGAGAQPPPLQRFTVQADGHPLAVWARVPAAPRRTVLLLHGRTWSSRPAFDLQVPGLHRSVLASLAGQGFAAYALDSRGYGATPRDQSGWLTPRRAAADVGVVLNWMAARHPALPRPALVGWSLGATIAHLAVATSPSLVSSLILYGYAPNPDEVIAPGDEGGAPLRDRNTREAAAGDFITPAVTPNQVIRAFVDTAIETDPVLADWRSPDQFTYDSSRISAPTLVMYGERDPGIAPATAAYFFAKLHTSDKQLVVIPGADHCAHLEDTHDAWIAAVANFINRPVPSRH
jgi:alpha-beta hydrolase superfamily lysophospholipase